MLVIALVWTILTTALLIAWGRFHAAVRRMEGIDETRYVQGADNDRPDRAA